MNTARNRLVGFAVAVMAVIAAAAPGALAQTKVTLVLPLRRTAYQTNERIHLAVVRSGPQALSAGDLDLTVTGDDASRMTFALAVPAVPAGDKGAIATEHVYVDGRLLRPGHYTIAAAVDGATATAEIDVYTHLRRSSFRLINWGRARGKDQLVEGEDSLGFNLFYGHYAGDEDANFIRAGVDFMRCCTMSGGHQMDLRGECDWSDPYVTRGGAARVVRQALADRTRPNVIGVHFYDEPGLTHLKHPVTGEHTPHGIPSQLRSYKSALGRGAPEYYQLDPKNPGQAAEWAHWARWKLGFMDAAWKMAQWGVSYVRPDYLSTTQSQYGWSAFTDGYYFNVVRCLPVISGHGGYHDYGLMLLNPVFFLEMARARDLARPCWYLPTWYGNTTSEQFRLEQYLCLQTGIGGLMTPPDIDPYEPAKKPAADGVVETNKLAARLGTIFTTMPVTRPPVAMLYSLSHLIHQQTLDRSVNYAHGDVHGRNLPLVYLAGKTLQHQFMPVVDEDVVDGTLAAFHKAIILTSISYLDPEVAAGLETFAADGGLVLLTGDCKVKIKGAVNLGVVPRLPDQEIVDTLLAEKKYAELGPYTMLAKQLQGARPLAKAIRDQLVKAGIGPTFECDNEGIAATRQAAGDIEYLFAVNAAIDPAGAKLNTAAAAATIGLADDGRPIYDAVVGGKATQFQKKGPMLRGSFRFGPGQMRVFARTRCPIGGVKALTPVLRRDYTITQEPLCVTLGAALLGADGSPLSGSAPLRLRLTDPLGKVRYDLYRATRLGALRLDLPLAANDPAGEWVVQVRDLLADTESRATFRYAPAARCGALAGRQDRAVYFGRDRDNVFRFFRVHRSVTIVKGTSACSDAAAERIAAVLKPWDVRCTTVDAADVNKPRQIPADAVKTWVGLQFGRVSTEGKLSIGHVGFDVQGPVILLGTPQDNPLIAYLAKEQFLPYAPTADEFPGRGRGFLAWQRDGVGHGQESITLIAYDAEGMSQAVGSMYEAMAGIEPLTPLVGPKANQITAATRTDVPPEPQVVWQACLPDRAAAMKADGDVLTVLTWDQSSSQVDRDGHAAAPKPLAPDAYAAAVERMKTPADPAAWKLAKDHPVPGRIPKFAASLGKLAAIGYWGGLVTIVDADGKVKTAHQFQDGLAGLVPFGEVLVVGLSDGRLVGLKVR